MKKWHLIIDIAKCENCNNCFLACKDEHFGNDWPGYSLSQPLSGHRWMNILKKERSAFPFIDVAYLPKPCMHCDDAPCIDAARDGAIYKRPDGIVLIDPKKAEGRRELTASCPYGAIWWNADAKVPQKCTLCAHLLDDGWKAPRCVQACPTGALSIHQSEDGEPIGPEKDSSLSVLGKADNPTRPRVFYRNLYRFTACFIAGCVITRQNGFEDCLADVTVELIKYVAGEDRRINMVTTDTFGDFIFDGLPPESGAYRIRIFDEGRGERWFDVNLGASQSIGVVAL